MFRTRWILLAAAAVMVLVVGCAPGSDVDHPAARAIQELLELRRADVRDASAYEPYFESRELAATLAEGSNEPTGTPRVPDWESPFVSEETTDTASVAVVWKADDAFPDWPAVNIFTLTLHQGRWVVIDAAEATVAPKPVSPDGAAE